MNKSFKKFLSVAVLATMVTGAGQAIYASAREIGNYSGKVPTLSDLESESIDKVNDTDAVNNCTKFKDKDNGKLVSWIEDSDDDNITSKVSYSSTGRRSMAYDDAEESIGESVHLNISTSSGTLHTIDTNGTWSPDAK